MLPGLIDTKTNNKKIILTSFTYHRF